MKSLSADQHPTKSGMFRKTANPKGTCHHTVPKPSSISPRVIELPTEGRARRKCEVCLYYSATLTPCGFIFLMRVPPVQSGLEWFAGSRVGRQTAPPVIGKPHV